AGGRIVETEAYPPGDRAGHGFIGETRRNRSLFLAHGHVYIYRTYGSAWMLNFSSEAAGVGAGVLIRAIEPLVGIDLMRARRPHAKLKDLARGPILLADDGFKAHIGRSVRIGISRNVDPRWRYFERGSPFISGPRRLNA
ncbi:MAG TPA: DNA-3-methyladenine glycosylase, partial [Hyphomicrobium sp.]|nr:DNA-3-methyladenine glycosylase [Hyphomicrobium sp.]